MGTLVLAGATSGSATLTPVDAVTAVITLPSATATLATLGANTFTGNQAITGTLSATSSLGYATGAGGTVTQSTDKSTGVTLNKPCGRITMNAASLGANTKVSFALTNSFIAATEIVVVSLYGAPISGGSYQVWVDFVDGGGVCTITLYNYSGGALAQAVPINFAVIKSVTS